MMLYREYTYAGAEPWKLRIEDAQPRELMDSELMEQIVRGTPWTKISYESGVRLLTIWDDYGHRYIYRIGDYDFQKDAYELEWPD